MSYTVRSGDTLSSIASRHGVSLAALEKANPQIHNPNSIYVGEHINLPGSKDTFHAAKKKAAPKKKAPNPVTTLKSDLSKMNKAVSAEHKAQHTYNVHVAAEKSALQKIEHQKETLETEFANTAPTDTATRTHLLSEIFTLGNNYVKTHDAAAKVQATDKKHIAADAKSAKSYKAKALKELKPAEYKMNLADTNKVRKELGLSAVKKAIRPPAPKWPKGFKPLTPAQFKSIAPNLGSKAETYTKYLNQAMVRFHITTPKREAAFLAQITEETAGFATLTEYASGAEYEGRRDLGNTHPGDGVRYKGRGAIQLTGRANYAAYGKKLGLDLINHPSKAADPSVAFLIAGQYWSDHGLNGLADKGDFIDITRRINGGTNGEAARESYWRKAKHVLGIG
jgi:putative chitinase